MSGKLIVFEGTDGSGKATQTALLCRELESRGVPFRKLEFPRYKEESSALLRLYLSGAFGTDPADVNAYAAATFFSVDRYASFKQDWGGWYRQDRRYASSRSWMSAVVWVSCSRRRIICSDSSVGTSRYSTRSGSGSPSFRYSKSNSQSRNACRS